MDPNNNNNSNNDNAVSLSKDEQWKLFVEGVRCVLSRWTALNLAIDNFWGGRNSREKAEDVLETILNTFHEKGSKVKQEQLEDYLYEVIEKEFHVMAEDGSVEEVTRLIMNIFHRISVNDPEFVRSFLNTKVPKGSENSVFQKPPDESSSDEDDSMDSDTMDMEEGEHVSGRAKVYDEEGWEVVTKKTGKKK
eukprot:TRINITY_DN7967_c0_g1_i3.p1 TRINITY_DN7967_c0_g1~~TRINITY_DN7967_c0_g1_i3.p1  ORF type:complete len:192 (-),score=65.79 TRINITY_DN7967_c0_g1_i3:68-643(-)